MVTTCKRANSKQEILIMQLLATHAGNISGLNWVLYKNTSEQSSKSLDHSKQKVDKIYGILMDKKSVIIGANSITKPSPPLSMRAAAFQDLPGYVQLDKDYDEFFVPIYPSTTKKDVMQDIQ